ncbi:MAG: hypothetical protein A3D74_02760 [Candidatus Levybacteria bacterium RIFCSPHIGHO2_02_FULL_37_13]|nr:MAG: hypothetical protein A3D74_02760 [Candidatus Levybacteria bacterium RIFCSPHIGHO2_02_FULL_37_13]
MDGFKKIELDAKAEKPVTNNTNKKKTIKVGIIILCVLVVLSVISIFTIVLPAQGIYAHAQKTMVAAKKVWDAVKKQNIEEASIEVEKTKKELKDTQDSLKTLSFVRFIPLLNNYYNDAEHLTQAGTHGLDAATELLSALTPYTDLLGLKGKGSFVMGTAEQRIQTAVLTMGKITPSIDEISKSLISARDEIDKVDANHYPSLFGLGKLKSELINVQKLADEGVLVVEQARPFIKTLPSLLGDPKEKKYLVLFQNDNELRPTGGFITAYAVFRIDKGIVHVDRSDDIYMLDNAISQKPKAPAPILKYLPLVNVLHLRDTNLSPDFIESMKTFNTLYNKAPGKIDVDGIIAIDTHMLVSTIKILDNEIYAGGIKFTTDNDPRCDCPQVIYRLEELVSTPKSLDLRITSLASVQAQRKDILGSLLYAIMEKALKSSPKLYWGPLFQDLFAKVSEKHVLAYLYNKDAQDGIEALNAAGRIKPYEGDYLHINEANFGGAKSNLFVSESVTVDYDVSSDGTITKKLTVNYNNPHAPSDCNLERGNLCINAVLRNWIRIYVPLGSKILDSKGSEVKMESYEELGKTVFEGFLTVRPKGSATFNISYRLPFKLDKASPLPLLIQKQPGTDNNNYTITVRGKEVEKFPLLTDKEIKIKL